MKQSLLRAERVILQLAPITWIVQAIIVMANRFRWIWGRIWFGALVPNRGVGCVCAFDSEIKYPQNLSLGDRVIIGSNASIGAHSPITIGDDVRISRDVVIETAGLDFYTQNLPYKHVSQPIVIERGVWIGARAIILGGVTLGECAIVAAGAVVTKSVGKYEIVAGVPARPVKKPKRPISEEPS